MMLFPIAGRKCWAVFEWWGQYYAVQGLLIPAAGAKYCMQTVKTPWRAEYAPEFDIDSRKELFVSERAAKRAARRLNADR